ncbi:hypothetical protein LBUL_0069 [Lactobacillus delbrueckii subsp. bulgaricus ATCC BAA-365]|nr:hypothetical protein LBUL_0069 [Lactobacillus delbrueckii subsp. bulgaricus ATCC BAA-365]KIY24235.1 hypothetical protein SB57_08680 [Lactobacillus delbrueckii subsp. bulgaricus]
MVGVAKSSDISKLTNNSQGSIFGDARNAFKDLQITLGSELGQPDKPLLPDHWHVFYQYQISSLRSR